VSVLPLPPPLKKRPDQTAETKPPPAPPLQLLQHQQQLAMAELIQNAVQRSTKIFKYILMIFGVHHLATYNFLSFRK